MLVPVIGLVPIGGQAWADRYAYLPTIGLYLAVVFGVSEATELGARVKTALAAASLPCLALLAWTTTRQLESWESSKTLFERALRVADESWLAHNNLGLIDLELGNAPAAKEHFAAALRLHPSFLEARYNLGLANQALGDLDQAVVNYRSVLELQPGHPETLLRLASLAGSQGDAQQALALLEQAIQKNPKNALAWLSLAHMVFAQGDIDRAVNCAESAVEIDDRLADGHLLLGEIALKRGELDEAGRRLERALVLAPESATGHAMLGRLRMQKKDLPGARRELERSIALDPDLVRGRYDLGTLLLSLGERDAARSQFQAVIDIHPGDAQALTALGVMAIDGTEKDPSRAIEFLSQALEQQPDFALALTNLAVAYELTGDWAHAVESYEKAFEAAPPDPDAARSLAWIRATGPDEALLDGEQAVELASYAAKNKADRALEVLAAAFARAGDFDQAVKVQQRALQESRSPQRQKELEERLRLFQSEKPFTRPR